MTILKFKIQLLILTIINNDGQNGIIIYPFVSSQSAENLLVKI